MLVYEAFVYEMHVLKDVLKVEYNNPHKCAQSASFEMILIIIVIIVIGICNAPNQSKLLNIIMFKVQQRQCKQDMIIFSKC